MSKYASDRLLLGIDIGGSHVGIGIIRDDGCVENVDQFEIENSKEITLSELLERIFELVERLRKAYFDKYSRKLEIKGIGVGCPGLIIENTLIGASNFPQLSNVKLADEIAKRISNTVTPSYLINDADAAISAEVWGNTDKYKSCKNIVMLTLGTGIGCGLILNNRLHQGSHGAIEAGHLIINSSNSTHGTSEQPSSSNNRVCGCGQRGCVEAYASAKNTALRLQELDQQLYSVSTSKSPKKNEVPTVLNAEEVFQRYASHDANAVQVVEETAEYLALLCINVSRVVDPDVIIFGGGMSNAGETLLSLIRKHIQLRTWTVLPTNIELTIANSVNSDHNGIIGAALAANKFLEETKRDSSTTQDSHSHSGKPDSFVHGNRDNEDKKNDTSTALVITISSAMMLAVGSQVKTRSQLAVRFCSMLLVGQLLYGINLLRKNYSS